mgnify:CR=1 FL=1
MIYECVLAAFAAPLAAELHSERCALAFVKLFFDLALHFCTALKCFGFYILAYSKNDIILARSDIQGWLYDFTRDGAGPNDPENQGSWGGAPGPSPPLELTPLSAFPAIFLFHKH